MSINGINSYATSFKGNNNTVKIGNKEVKKSTLAAAGVTTAAVATTIALGVAGKRSGVEATGNIIKKATTYVAEGAKVFGNKVKGLFKKGNQELQQVAQEQTQPQKTAEKEAEKVADKVADKVEEATEKVAEKVEKEAEKVQDKTAELKAELLKKRNTKEAIANEEAYIQKTHLRKKDAKASFEAIVEAENIQKEALSRVAQEEQIARNQELQNAFIDGWCIRSENYEPIKKASDSAEVFVEHEKALKKAGDDILNSMLNESPLERAKNTTIALDPKEIDWPEVKVNFPKNK